MHQNCSLRVFQRRLSGTDWSPLIRVYEHTTSLQHQAVSTILSSSNKTTFQDAMLTPSTTAHLADSSSTPYAPNNIFQNCSVQVIQTIQPPQLPPIPPPPVQATQPQWSNSQIIQSEHSIQETEQLELR